MTKIVSFDLDGTLVKSNYADAVWLKGLPEIYSKEKNVSFEDAKKFLFRKYDEISNQRVEWYDIAYWFKCFNLKSSWKELLEKYSFAVEAFDDVEGVLEKLSKKFDLIISSNAKTEFIDVQIKKLGFDKYFKDMFSAISDFSCVKKHPKFYLQVSKSLNVEPYEMYHVGDSLEFDYVSAKKVGVKAFCLDRNSLNDAENVVRNLNDFVKKII